MAYENCILGAFKKAFSYHSARRMLFDNSGRKFDFWLIFGTAEKYVDRTEKSSTLNFTQPFKFARMLRRSLVPVPNQLKKGIGKVLGDIKREKYSR